MTTVQAEQVPSFGLSPQQEYLLDAGEAVAVSQCCFLLDGSRADDGLRDALERAVARHEALRTTFVRPTGARVPVAQAIHGPSRVEWTSETGEESLLEDAGRMEALMRREAGRLDLEEGPGFRALHVELPSSGSLLVLSALAACADLASLCTVVREALDGESPGDPVQYADYADWRKELLASEDSAEGRAFWAETVGALVDVPPLLFGATGPSHASGRRETVEVRLEKAELDAIATAAEEARSSTDAFVEAAWHALLARLTGENAVTVASGSDGRSQAELRDAVGPYAQVLPIRSQLSETTSFAEVLDRVRRARALGARREDLLARGDLVAVGTGLSFGFAVVPTVESATVRSASGAPLGRALDLQWYVDGRLVLRFETTDYGRPDVEAIARSLRALLASAAADGARRVVELALLPQDSRSRESFGLAGAERDFGHDCIHRLFEAQAARTPDLPAVAGVDDVLTYRELNERANRLARHLQAVGAARGAAVGLCMDRTPAMLTALLAIMKAGCAYLPLNFEHPPARLEHQLREANASLVVTQAAFSERLPVLESTAPVYVDGDASEIATHEAADLDDVGDPSDLAYVMYTSGSTGLPKGVGVTHANLVNYTMAIAERLEVEEGWVFAVVSAISTDLGNTGIFPPLVSGGCVQLVSPEIAMDGEAFGARVQARPIDVLKITPSHLRALLGSGDAFLPRRWLVVGGEASSWDLIEHVRGTGAACRILNHYGPTETTIGCCTFEVEARTDASSSATVPIGAPIANLRAYVLDGMREPVPAGVAAELCIAGAGVAAGYVGRPEETAERFVEDPLGPAGARMYRTGDRARLLPDGSIEFLGRMDEQVKIRGFRVEPGEIEAALVRHPAVREAAVVSDAEGHDEPRLVAYVVASPQPTAAELRSFLSESLPDFMVPSFFEPLEALPFTPSGKIDRISLPEPGRGAAAMQEEEYVAPRDDLEAEIAAIWADLLGVERVGVLDDFFALGGHSLLATQAVIRIRRVHGSIPLGALFKAPTVEALANVIRSEQAGPEQPHGGRDVTETSRWAR